MPQAGAFLIYVVMIIMLLLRPNGIIPRKGIA
jgi:branched-chain amino acid transport system permease protein